MDKRQLRQTIFRHLDGIATAPVAFALYQKGVLEYILKHRSVTLGELQSTFQGNEGYLNVGLRVLCSQGWLVQQIAEDHKTLTFSLNEKSETAFHTVSLYKVVVELLSKSAQYHPRKFEREPFLLLESLFAQYQNRFGLQKPQSDLEAEIQNQVLKHIEGILVGPSIVHLGMSGMFHKYFMESSFTPAEFHDDPDSFRSLLDFFAYLGWFTVKGDHYRFTDIGIFFAKRASAYGVTVSYIPTFRQVYELMFGDPTILWNVPTGLPEIHVDRAMNVWGSGGAHAGYFKIIDEIIIDIFNQPIEKQPKGILDMGCGNGAFLQHLFYVIESHTQRGKMLDDYPLFLVGVDYNEAALTVTRGNLIKAAIWAKVIWGDISDPDRLSKDLLENYETQLADLLNVRSFLDHNRRWQEPRSNHSDSRSNHSDSRSKSTGAFAYKGKRLPNYLVQDNLLEHLEKWKPYVSNHGLLLIELHTIDPTLAASHLGHTAVTAYDATHGFSDQYIVEIEVFHEMVEKAGLCIDKKHFTRFPDSDLATISINLLAGA